MPAMRRSDVRIRLVICSMLFMLLLPVRLFPQEAVPDTLIYVADTLKADEKTSPHALYASAGFGSNMVYLGTTMSQDQPFGYAGLTYGLNNSLYVSLSATSISGIDPFISIYSGSLSYNHTFNSWFDISAGLYSYYVPPVLRDTLFGNFAYADLTGGIDWRFLYSKISVGTLIADQSQIYLQFRNSRYFQTGDFLRGKANISFDPYINFIAGTYSTAETISGNDTVVSPVPPFGKGRQRDQTDPTNSQTIYSRNFSMMELDFGLPVAINFDLFTFEIEAGYLLPLSSDPYLPSSEGFILLVSAYFRIF